MLHAELPVILTRILKEGRVPLILASPQGQLRFRLQARQAELRALEPVSASLSSSGDCLSSLAVLSAHSVSEW